MSQASDAHAGFQDVTVRRALRELLVGRSAHADLATALRGLPVSARAVRPAGHPHSVWELVEHLRIGLRDLIDYTVDPDATSPPWPDGYWPDPDTDVGEERWNASVAGLEQGLAELRTWIDDAGFDLGAEIAWSEVLPGGGKRTPLRQVLVAADHLAYHLGQIVTVRRALGVW